MAVRRIEHADGSATLIADSYAAYGEFGGQPSRKEKSPEEKAAEERADCINRDELARMLKTPVENLDTWSRFGLPKSPGFTPRKGHWGAEPYWSRREVMPWLRDFKAFAANLPE
jgi:hypothetical protein